MRKYALRRDANEPEVIKALEAIGCDVYPLHEPADLLVGFRGLTLLIEVKDGDKPPSKRKLTPRQVKFHAQWRGHKAEVKSVDEAVMEVIKHTAFTA